MALKSKFLDYAKEVHVVNAASAALKVVGIAVAIIGVLVALYIRMRGHGVPDYNGGHSLLSYFARNALIFISVSVGLLLWHCGVKVGEQLRQCGSEKESHVKNDIDSKEDRCIDASVEDSSSSSTCIDSVEFLDVSKGESDVPSLSRTELKELLSRSKHAK